MGSHKPCPARQPHSSMVLTTLSLILLVSVCSGLPAPQNQTPNENGDYNFSFQNSGQRDRQARQESGFGPDSEVVEGSYSFLTPEGQEVAVSYTADENGYYPKGSSIHPALARALEHLRRQNGGK
eukprot:TRINITY_DN1038_c0_g1_i1.p1 TRINITY_DN1038_c0_g1~~TRINITY_DN1038_c0_g1_i1.p1  ORF type:complete len:141 (+),score=63.99 TRINITY_DN1038_c0_g1_i1:50-424(+)